MNMHFAHLHCNGRTLKFLGDDVRMFSNRRLRHAFNENFSDSVEAEIVKFLPECRINRSFYPRYEYD